LGERGKSVEDELIDLESFQEQTLAGAGRTL
jgi:hypothetical protein